MENLESLLDIEVENLSSQGERQGGDKGSCFREHHPEKPTRDSCSLFYIIEFLSQRAVNMASISTKDSDPYLSRRFSLLRAGRTRDMPRSPFADLRDLGEKESNPFCLEIVREYDEFLQSAAERFPLAILGHSYLFENVSGLLFPEIENRPRPPRRS